MSTYQDVVAANLARYAWALTEAAGTDFPPYIGAAHLTGSGTLLYQQSGPFATSLALHLATNARLVTPAGVVASQPTTLETWLSIDTYPPSAAVAAFYWGNSGANGVGVLIQTNGNIGYYVPPNAVIDTGVPFGSGWHLIQLGNLAPTGSQVAIARDGIIVWQATSAAQVAANPNQVAFGSTPVANAGAALKLAFPAIYNQAITPQLALSSYLASTDPDSAMGYTLGAAANNLDILNQILASVRKTY